MTIVLGPALAVSMVVAVLLAAAVAWAAQLGTSRGTVTAALRATVQLGVVSLLIGAIVGSESARQMIASARDAQAGTSRRCRRRRSNTGIGNSSALRCTHLAAAP